MAVKEYKKCNPNEIHIPKEIIKSAEKKGKIIEKSYGKYGPSVINNFLQIGKNRENKEENKPEIKFINEILIPYETLCFYEIYFKGAHEADFKKIDAIFEKARGTLASAAKRSATFKDAFKKYNIIYDKNEVMDFKYKENPDDDDETRFNILKDNKKKPVPNFPRYCAKFINDSYDFYKKNNRDFHKEKKNLAKGLTENDRSSYDMIKLVSREARKATKILYKIPHKIDELVENANTKKHRFQIKLFSSNELDKLIAEKEKLEIQLELLENHLNKLAKYKYKGYEEEIFRQNEFIDKIYYNTTHLRNKLILGKIEYEDEDEEIQEQFNTLRDCQAMVIRNKKQLNTNTNTNANANANANKNKKRKQKINSIYMKAKKYSASIKTQALTFEKNINTLDKAIKNFQDGYKAKAWAKWIAMKAGVGSLQLVKEVNNATVKIEILNKVIDELQNTLNNLSNN